MAGCQTQLPDRLGNLDECREWEMILHPPQPLQPELSKQGNMLLRYYSSGAARWPAVHHSLFIRAIIVELRIRTTVWERTAQKEKCPYASKLHKYWKDTSYLCCNSAQIALAAFANLILYIGRSTNWFSALWRFPFLHVFKDCIRMNCRHISCSALWGLDIIRGLSEGKIRIFQLHKTLLKCFRFGTSAAPFHETKIWV